MFATSFSRVGRWKICFWDQKQNSWGQKKPQRQFPAGAQVLLKALSFVRPHPFYLSLISAPYLKQTHSFHSFQAGNSRTPVDAIRGDPQAGPSGYRLPSPQQDTEYGSRSPTYASPDSPREDPESTWQPPPRGSQLQRPNSLDLPGSSRVSQPLAPVERTTKYAQQFPVGKTNKPRWGRIYYLERFLVGRLRCQLFVEPLM